MLIYIYSLSCSLTHMFGIVWMNCNDGYLNNNKKAALMMQRVPQYIVSAMKARKIVQTPHRRSHIQLITTVKQQNYGRLYWHESSFLSCSVHFIQQTKIITL